MTQMNYLIESYSVQWQMSTYTSIYIYIYKCGKYQENLLDRQYETNHFFMSFLFKRWQYLDEFIGQRIICYNRFVIEV